MPLSSGPVRLRLVAEKAAAEGVMNLARVELVPVGGPVAVEQVALSEDRRRVTLRCDGRRSGYVHELVLGPLLSATGQALRYNRAYYTLNRIPAP
jgi:hypothetical protein